MVVMVVFTVTNARISVVNGTHNLAPVVMAMTGIVGTIISSGA
jgi:hypothetical protein